VKTEMELAATRSPAQLPARLAHDIMVPIRRLPDRLHDGRFWRIQLMVFAATAPHYIIETVGFTNPFETFHGLAITLYVIPLLYAAIAFGWEGAILTAVWIVVLTSPSMWVWHRSSYHWLTEVGQLAITLPAGIMVAWRVDLESKQRQRAEQTSASLGLLNEIGERLSHTLDVEQALPGVVALLVSELPVDAVWLCLEPESPGGERRVIREMRHPAAGRADVDVDRLHEIAAATREPVRLGGRVVAVPLSGEGGILGSLGAAMPEGYAFTDDQEKLLATVAHEIRVAVENGRLYQQRQESLQTYARQVTQAQEDERLRISRELHDETAQELVHIVRRIERLGEAAHADVPKQVDELLTLARGTLQSVRRFSRDLRPSVLDDLGLVPAIELAVEATNTRLPGGAKLDVTGEPRRLGPAVELALFRIAQEALHNVEKHAEATSASVQLAFEQGAVRLDVTDDGRGCELPQHVSQLARKGKLGVLGMKERAELVGGSFDFSSIPGQGSRVSVVVTQDEAEDARIPMR
jgi:signal transduction histidine kinase